jgi:putative glycosyltransferase (TIGR04372 family)
LRNLANNRHAFQKLLVINPGGIANSQIYKMYGNQVNFIDCRFPLLLKGAIWVYGIFEKGMSRLILYLSLPVSKYHYEWNNLEPSLSFSNKEMGIGMDYLRGSMLEEGKYICFGLRELGYYEGIDTLISPEASTDYCHRNPPLSNYARMANNLINKNLGVVRVGKKVNKSLTNEFDKKIIDYANLNRSDFLDVFLHAKAKFVVSGASGNWSVATAFNVPIVLSDSYDLRFRVMRKGDLFIPKKYWLIQDKRFLTFSEMISRYENLDSLSKCQKLNIEVLHNTSEEIWDVVDEMNQRIDGVWQTTEEDEYLNKLFDQIYMNYKPEWFMPCRMGAKFLRQHKELLI